MSDPAEVGFVESVTTSSTSIGSTGYALSQSDLQDAVGQAIAYWASEGIAADQLAGLSQVHVKLASLPGSTLGLASESTNAIWIDVDAAGRGWSTTPAASSGVDLLSTVIHEFGHSLGLHHDVLGATLDVGVRSLPNFYTSPLQVELPHSVTGATLDVVLRNVDWLHSNLVHKHDDLRRAPVLMISPDAFFGRLNDQWGPSRMTRLYDDLANSLNVDWDSSDDTQLSPTQSRIAAELTWLVTHRPDRVQGTSADHDMTEEEEALDGLFATYDDDLAISDR